MKETKYVVIDGNEAAAHVAYHVSEVMAIYPITPSSNMGEWVDAWSAQKLPNIWGTVPDVVEMQSEGGAAGAVHGSLQAGSLCSTFTASQGLLLMIPNMYKIAGELTPTVFHIAARSLAYQALSIFGDHSDVMSARQTGFAMLASNSVQEAMDLALVAHAATLKASIPFMHFFDGFRTSHEENKVEILSTAVISSMIDDADVITHRSRGLTPDRPVMRGTAQNPDVYFQGRESANEQYAAAAGIVQDMMDRFAKLVGRSYRLFDYVGDANPEKVIILMGSGAETVQETVGYLCAKGEKVGLIKVRLYRPFSAEHLLQALPATVKKIAVLDRTKESGATGEPLYLDVLTSLTQAYQRGELKTLPKVIGGRYGLSSKEFVPAMVKAVYDELDRPNSKNSFTVGINDDVTKTSLTYDPDFDIEPSDTFRGIFWGLGSDGTVSANKNSIKIIGEETENYAQGYFVYDSKKSGGVTNSHLRFGKKPIHSTYLITKANFVACHLWTFIEKYDVLGAAAKGATFLLNSPYEKEEVWNQLPKKVQEQIISKELKLYVINAARVARETEMGVRINTIMQTCFFAISGILPSAEAVKKIKDSIRASFGKRGDEVVQKNFHAVDQSVSNLFAVEYPKKVTSAIAMTPVLAPGAPAFVQEVTGKILAMKGESLPVSAIPKDGTYPTATTQWEKRNIAEQVPVWDPSSCIQCGKCVNVCPHASIRSKAYSESLLANAPASFKSVAMKGKYDPGTMYTIQVAVEDCTGCELCVEVCPAKNKSDTSLKAINMATQRPIREQERTNWNYFLQLPDYDRHKLNLNTVKDSQLLRPLFEFSGACAGCGETPYIKLVTQLFGDRMLVANATGCSSIYGGNLPTTPYCKNTVGKGPAWSNSLFEDNAEFGLGFRLAVDRKNQQAKELLLRLKSTIGETLVTEILTANQDSESGVDAQRERVGILQKQLAQSKSADAQHLASLADYLVKKSVWIFGGDGWAYDIGYGGLDHVIASGKNVNILVLDTEVYSNTGGQMSKSTPTGAVAKFAAGGKAMGKKDLALQAMGYGHVYVAKISMGANDAHTLKAIREAESYDGPSLIIAYSHCIAHGYNLKYGIDMQKKAVDSGHWHLFRYDPRLRAENKNPFQLDSKVPKLQLKDYMDGESRFKMLHKIDPQRAVTLAQDAQKQAAAKWRFYQGLAAMSLEEGPQ